MSLTLYHLKPAFQSLLRPLVTRLAHRGVTANVVTTAALLGSVALGALLALDPARTTLFLLLPAWMLLRMALNAIDGMLAREFGHRGSTLHPDFRPFSESASSAGAGLTAAIAKALWWHVCNRKTQA